MMEVSFSNKKDLTIKPSGRSTDFITPSFIFGCGFNCSYCYCKRNVTDVLKVYKNTEDILTEINSHAYFSTVDKPNQTHEKYVTYDIGCNTDVALHAKHLEWEKIFQFFKEHPVAMGSFATKYVNKKFLEFNPEGKIRIRFSLMPESLSEILEPNTTSILERIQAINLFIKAGYDVHINFSPVIVNETWLKDYAKLFDMIQYYASRYGWNNEKVKAEVIFLTHNAKKHEYNVEHSLPGEDLLWTPSIQEGKISQYGGKNIRYKHDLKAGYIEEWLKLKEQKMSWLQIRYIF